MKLRRTSIQLDAGLLAWLRTAFPHLTQSEAIRDLLERARLESTRPARYSMHCLSCGRLLYWSDEATHTSISWTCGCREGVHSGHPKIKDHGAVEKEQ